MTGRPAALRAFDLASTARVADSAMPPIRAEMRFLAGSAGAALKSATVPSGAWILMLPSWHALFGRVTRVAAGGRRPGGSAEEFVALASGGLHWSFWGVMSLARVSGRRPHPGLARGVLMAAAGSGQ